MRHRLAYAVAVSVLIAALATGSPSPASAVARFDPLSASDTVALLADCSRVTPNGRDYAEMHDLDLCGVQDTPEDRPLPTEAVGGEECGSLTLTTTGRGAGLVAVEWRVASRTGPILGMELDLTVSGRAGDTVHHFATAVGSPLASDGVVVPAGVGNARVTLSGTVETFTTTCTVASASARTFVR